MTLVWERRRLVCERCGCRLSEDPSALGGRLTARLARRVVQDTQAMTVNAAARRHKVSWKLVNALVVAWAATVAQRRRRRCRQLLVDETSIRRRHRYVTVLVNGDTGEVLAIVPHRSKAALSGFLAAQGNKCVQAVVSDGAAAYKTAIDARLGHACHVLDRICVIRWFQCALTAARRDMQHRREGSKPRFGHEVFRARFLPIRRPDKLDAVFVGHPRLQAAWDALGELHGLYLVKDRKGALETLDRFAGIYRTGQIPEFGSVVDTYLAWHEEILGWHRAGRPPNGRIEGTNLLQVLRRKAHSFTNYAHFEARGSPTT